MDATTLASLHSNQRILVQELLARGVEVALLVHELELLEARYGNHVELLLDRDGSCLPYSAALVCSDKYLTKRLLCRAGLTVPRGEQFFANQRQDALGYARRLGFPVVIKPTQGSHGDGCYFDITDEEGTAAAFDALVARRGPSAGVLIERQCRGHEFRFFVTRRGDCAVVHRDPASVTGDGVATIAELAERESERRLSPRTNCLCPIVIDGEVERFLRARHLTLHSIPARGRKVYLRRSSNVSQGGMCEDYTERVHPSAVAIAQAALAAVPGLPYAGVDILSTDIAKPQTPKSYRILEINSNPGLHLHTRPGIGQGRNVAAFLADILFPETCATGVDAALQSSLSLEAKDGQKMRAVG